VPSSLPAIWLNQSRCSVGWNIGVVFNYNSWAYLYFILYHRKFFDAPQYTHLLQRTELIWEHYFCTERRKKCIVHEKHKTFKIFLLLYISASQLQYQVTMQMIRKTTFFINPYSYWRRVNCNYSTEYAWGNTKLPLKQVFPTFFAARTPLSGQSILSTPQKILRYILLYKRYISCSVTEGSSYPLMFNQGVPLGVRALGVRVPPVGNPCSKICCTQFSRI